MKELEEHVKACCGDRRLTHLQAGPGIVVYVIHTHLVLDGKPAL